MRLKESSSSLARVLHLVDSAGVVACLWLLVGILDRSWSRYYTYLALMSYCLSLLLFHLFRLYRSWRGVDFYKEFLTILRAWGGVVGVVLSCLFLFKVSDRFSRTVILTWFIATPFVIFAIHASARMILRRLRASGKNLKQAVIAGTDAAGRAVFKYVEDIPWTGINVLGFFTNGTGGEVLGSLPGPVLGPIEELPEYLRNNDIDYVYLALPMKEEEAAAKIVAECRTVGCQIYFVPDFEFYKILNARVESLGDMILLNFNPDSTFKRYFDVSFSALSLLLTLPVFLAIGLAIKLEDGGPVFYRHKRITLTGKFFECLKFRTMYPDADKKLHELLQEDPAAAEEWQRTFKLKNDPRVTKIGRVLRKTSLDELPQFINVLRGEMSVVGARPIVREELYKYYKENGGLYCSAKPGITGPWQVGQRNDIEDYEARIALDMKYILNQSVWLDLSIIARTVWVVMRGKGAY